VTMSRSITMVNLQFITGDQLITGVKDTSDKTLVLNISAII